MGQRKQQSEMLINEGTMEHVWLQIRGLQDLRRALKVSVLTNYVMAVHDWVIGR